MKSGFFCMVLILLASDVPVLTDEGSSVNHEITVLTFNIFHGATTRGDYDLDRIARVIRDAGPDLVALQEVDYRTHRAKKMDLALELGYKTGLIPLFGKAMSFDGGEYGNAVLSKWSLIRSRVIPLPFREGHEPRVAVEVVTAMPAGDTLVFVSTHLDYLNEDSVRMMQVNHLIREMESCPYPMVLAGDFNDVPDSRTIQTLQRIWSPAYTLNHPEYTFPSDRPDRKIDYVMMSPKDGWEVISRQVIRDSVASDHCAYRVRLRKVIRDGDPSKKNH